MLESESRASWNSILAKDVALCKSPLVLIYLWKRVKEKVLVLCKPAVNYKVSCCNFLFLLMARRGLEK